ncbi:MAG: methyltransferase domain-containing protein [bacterium]|nr:methyltransferase domain-containing protein [bacterium]
MSQKKSGWWEDFFPAFKPLFGVAGPAATRDHVRFLIKKLNLKNGTKFLDCPCGIGRISVPLAKAGVKVTGVDITQSYLADLAQISGKKKLAIRLFHNDMRRIQFKNEFEAAGNLWTSFGYFEKESDNLLVLKRMFAALKPGGKFVLHLINRDWIMANFRASNWFEFNGIKVLETRKFDFSNSINYSKWTFIKEGEEQTFDVAIRMYSYHELAAMFRKVGFVNIEGLGNEKEEPVSLKDMMTYIFGTKPK